VASNLANAGTTGFKAQRYHPGSGIDARGGLRRDRPLP
jgi:flagellar basal body rod protein FlgF